MLTLKNIFSLVTATTRQHLLHRLLQEVVGGALFAVPLVRRNEIVLNRLVDDVLYGGAPPVQDRERPQDLQPPPVVVSDVVR